MDIFDKLIKLNKYAKLFISYTLIVVCKCGFLAELRKNSNNFVQYIQIRFIYI